MRAVARFGRGAALGLTLALAGVAAGQSERLQEALRLFERQDYVAAQEAALAVERADLTAAELDQLDALLKEVPEAIQGAERTQQVLAEADKAYEAGQWDAAERHYGAVAENKYARATAREYAGVQLERIAEKRTLAEAVKPSGALEERRVEPPVYTYERKPGEPPPPPGEPPPAPGMPPAPPLEEEAGPQRLTPTAQLRLRDELLWQQAVARSQQLAAESREALAANDFARARQLSDTALQAIEAMARYAEPAARYEAARAEMLTLQQEVRDAEQAFQITSAERERAEIAARIEARRRLLEEQKQESIQQLFNSADQLRSERRFSEAADVLRQVLRLDPGNVRARLQLDWAEDYESFDAQRQWRNDMGTEGRRALLQADEALIPWDYDVLYPRNWLELTANRTAAGAQTGADLEDVELNRRLEETLPEVRFSETPFEQVVDFLADMSKLNFAVDWTDLDDTLLTPAREKPVTVQLQNLKLRTVLKEVLAQVGGETELSYAVADGLIRIATKEKLNKDKFTLIYDVRDLLAIIPQSGQPDFSQNTQGLSTQGGGGGQSVFGGQQGRQQQQQEQGPLGQAEMEKLKEIIRQTVEPDSWVEAGAGPGGGSIQDLNGQLLIYNTSDAQRQVGDLLGQLRETQALQVSVEARFLDVTENFLEQFGVDLDFVFNSGNAGYDRAPDLVDPFSGAPVLIPRQYSRIGSIPATPGFGQPLNPAAVPGQPYGQAGLVPAEGMNFPLSSNEMTPVAAQQGSLGLVDPTAINTAVPGSWAQRSGLQPALSIAGSFLDNLQVDFLIRATQANQRSSIVQAPRAVMTNGQAVEIRIERVRSYVSSLEPVVGENVALPRPIVEEANAGISMWVQAVISADRRYTKLSIALLNQGEPTFERFELQRGSGSSPSIFILLPNYSRITYTTTVSVPDGGTVLLGGFKQAGEVEVEAGVPILSKIPVLKRAFTNTTTVKDTRTLLILVKSKILIQKEAEEEAFPTWTQAGN